MRGALSVAGRVLASVRGDHRTLALVVGAPIFIIFLFDQVLEQVPAGRFDARFVQPVILGFFVFFLTYILTAIGFLRERQNGTLERILVSPASRTGLVVGYLAGYGLLALVQIGVILGCAVWLFDVSFVHGLGPFFLFEVLGAITALGLGILVSFLAKTEFQVLQFMPVVIAPQLILGGVFVPVESLPAFLEYPARVMPLTYLLEGMNYAVLGQGDAVDVAVAAGVLCLYVLGSIVLAAFAVRRSQ